MSEARAALALRSGVRGHPTDYADVFAPARDGTRFVRCKYCQRTYCESDLLFGEKPAVSGLPVPLWWCPTPDCIGAGLGHDIRPVEGETRPARRGKVVADG